RLLCADHRARAARSGVEKLPHGGGPWCLHHLFRLLPRRRRFVAKWPPFAGLRLCACQRGPVPGRAGAGHSPDPTALTRGHHLDVVTPMLDPRLVRSDPETVAIALAKRGFSLDVAWLRDLEDQRRAAQERTQALQAERNAYAKAMGKEMAAAKAEGRDLEPLKAKGEALKNAVHDAEAELEAIQARLEAYLLEVPNTPDVEVPEGKREDDNVEIRRWGEPRAFAFEPRDHVDLGAPADLLDFEAATKVAGSRFAVTGGERARLHRALIQFMLATHIDGHGYREVYVPYIVNRESLLGTGQLPKFAADLFKLDDEREFYLIPTAEVPVTNIHR